MNVFLVWSNDRSHEIALALKDLLETCVQGPSYFISDEIESGRLWRSALAEELSASDFGIVCITPENRRSPWLHFEAGAIAKAVGQARVVPYLYCLSPTDVEPPLGDFQAVCANEGETRELVLQLARSREGISEDHVRRVFDGLAWSEFEQRINSLTAPEGEDELLAPRQTAEKINEILQRLRDLDSQSLTPVTPDDRAIYLASPAVSEVVSTYWYVVPTRTREAPTSDTGSGERSTVTVREPDIPSSPGSRMMVEYDDESALLVSSEPIDGQEELSRQELEDECEARGITYSSAIRRVRRGFANR